MIFFPTMPVRFEDEVVSGKYHFLQADDLASHPECPTGYYKNLGAANNTHLVILDNGAAEHGAGDMAQLRVVAEVIKPDVIVVPDVVNQMQRTLDNMNQYAETCYHLAPHLMWVPQGSTAAEWVNCCSMMFGVARAGDFIGITKFVNGYWSRDAACAVAISIRDELQAKVGLHLLGTSGGFDELVRLSFRYPELYSADTTWPFAYSLRVPVECNPIRDGHASFDTDPTDWNISELKQATLDNIRINITICTRMLEQPIRYPTSIRPPLFASYNNGA